VAVDPDLVIMICITHELQLRIRRGVCSNCIDGSFIINLVEIWSYLIIGSNAANACELIAFVRLPYTDAEAGALTYRLPGIEPSPE